MEIHTRILALFDRSHEDVFLLKKLHGKQYGTERVHNKHDQLLHDLTPRLHVSSMYRVPSGHRG